MDWVLGHLDDIGSYTLQHAWLAGLPLVLGLVLGDLMEKGLRRGLVLSDGSLAPFFTRPISMVLWITILLVILLKLPMVRRLFSRRAAADTG